MRESSSAPERSEANYGKVELRREIQWEREARVERERMEELVG